MTSADFCLFFPKSLNLGSSTLLANKQISPGIAHTPSRLCLPHLRPSLPCRYRTLKILANSSAVIRLLCGFCSSSQRFACGFLQISSRDEHPCRPANSSPCRVCKELSSSRVCALPGAPKKSRVGKFPPCCN